MYVSRKSFLPILAVIAGVSLLIRLEVCRELYLYDPAVAHPRTITDMETYMSFSDEIMEGRFCEEFYYQPFYFAFFLPAVLTLTGGSVFAVLAVQSILGAATVWLTGICGALLWRRTAGIAAALLACFCRELIFHTSYFLFDTLKTFLAVLLLRLLLAAIRSRDLRFWILPGVACALLILTRASTMVFLPAVAAFMFVRHRRKFRSIRDSYPILLRLGVFAGICLILLLPYSWHNWNMAGSLAGPSTGGAANIALGNNPGASPGLSGPSDTYRHWMASKERSPLAWVASWALESPLAFSELIFRKLLLFWDGREIYDNISFEREGGKSLLLRTIRFVPASILMILFLASLVCIPPRRLFIGRLLLPILLIASYWAVTSLFYVVTRYKLPLFPFLAMFSGILIDLVVSNVSGRRRRGFMLRSAAGIAFGILLVCHGYDSYRFRFEPRLMRVIRPDGERMDAGSSFIHCDNGPYELGAWLQFKLEKGDTITKSLVLPPPKDGERTEFSLQLRFAAPGTLKLQINGIPFGIREHDASAWKDYACEIPFPQGGAVEILVDEVDVPVYAFADNRRAYGRTSVNGDVPAAELVCRLRLKK